MPDWSGALNGEEQERRRKGKEIVPFDPAMSGYRPQGFVYPGEYGAGSYRTVGGPLWAAQPPPQPVPLPSLPVPGEDYAAKKAGQHARFSNQQQKESHRRRRSRSPQHEITITRKVDGILTPDSGDLTVRLTMDVEEDLEHQLDEMNRLSRLGRFSAAKKFFNENLQRWIDNPYVLVQYADLLLHQGDFTGVRLLQDKAIYKRHSDKSDSEDLRILRVNWELLQVLAKSRTLDSLKGVYTIFKEAIDVLDMIADDPLPDRPISSTEIQLLALTLRLTGDPMLNSKWLKYGGRALAAFPVNLMQLYQALLRHGRVWDLHDLIVLLPMVEDIKAFAHDIFGKDLAPSLQTMISDWLESVHGYDSSMVLGLLSIMTHILLEPVGASEKECIDIFQLCLPLALSIMQKDPDSLKSRPYLRLLLAKSRFSETASRKAMESLKSHLRSSQGVFYQRDIALLPMYIPLENEVPQWTPADQPPELKDPVRLVLKSAIALGDFQTEVLARRELIRLSSNPREDFDMLCALQLSRQGDLNGYGLTLASKLLVSDTEVARAELASAISRLLSTIVTTAYWGPSYEWVIHVLLHKLEKRSSATIQDLLGRSNVDYQKMEEPLLREISKKMPEFQDWVDQQQEANANPKQTKPKDTVLRAAPGFDTRRNDRRSVKIAGENQGGRQASARGLRQSRQDTIHEREEEGDITLIAGSKPGGGSRHRLSPHDDRGFSPSSSNAIPRGAADRPRYHEESPAAPYIYPTDRTRETQERQVPSSAAKPIVVDDALDTVRQDQRALQAQLKDLREKLDDGYNKILEAARESDRKQANDMRAISEELKKEVEKIRQDTVEQVDKKNRIEAQERAEQKEWVRQQLIESNLEKAAAMERFEERTAELDAKFEITRKVAVEVAEKRAEVEYKIRTMKEDEARRQEALELRKVMEAEIRAQEEARAAEKIQEEIERRIAAERQERREAEKKEVERKAMEAAMKQVEEEKKRLWVVEDAQDDKNHIHLKDAVGRKLTIPFDQGRTWQGMVELIEAAFEKVDGVEPAVRAGRYDLLGPDNTYILPQTWEDTVQRGWSISMRLWPQDKPPQPPRPSWMGPKLPPYPTLPGGGMPRPRIPPPPAMAPRPPYPHLPPPPLPVTFPPPGAVVVDTSKAKARKSRKQKDKQRLESSDAEAEAEAEGAATATATAAEAAGEPERNNNDDDDDDDDDEIVEVVREAGNTTASSSDYESSLGSERSRKKKKKRSRPREIISNAFSSLHMNVFRRGRRSGRRWRRDRSPSRSTVASSSGGSSVSSVEIEE